MARKTKCPNCEKSGDWSWNPSMPQDKIKHSPCGSIFDKVDWLYNFKTDKFLVVDKQ